MTDTIPFTHEGKQYEIRCTCDDHTIYVRAFLDGNPANGFEHCVELPDALKEWNGISAVQPLIDSAMHDIVNRSWEQIQDFFRQR